MSLIHYFNPGHEYAVLNREPSYTPPANMLTMMRDLSSLPVWYADRGDVVLVDDVSHHKHCNELRDLGLILPSLVKAEYLKKINQPEVCMWGVSPRSIRYFQAVNRDYNLALKLPSWHDNFFYLTSRMVSKDVLSSISQSSSYFDFIQLPEFYSDIKDVEERTLQSSETLLSKAPFSSSGKGLLWLPPGELKRSERQILQGVLNKQKSVSIEHVYNKVVDFAMEFMSDGDGRVTFEGYSLFLTNDKGGYQANRLESQETIQTKIQAYISTDIVLQVQPLLIERLSALYGPIYKGCMGVDMMVVKVEDEYKLHPCVEINMRYNMGFLSLQLFDKYINPESTGSFCVDFDNKSMHDKHEEMRQRYPLIVEDSRVKSGYLSLCPVRDNTKYRAYILIEG